MRQIPACGLLTNIVINSNTCLESKLIKILIKLSSDTLKYLNYRFVILNTIKHWQGIHIKIRVFLSQLHLVQYVGALIVLNLMQGRAWLLHLFITWNALRYFLY